MTDPRNNDRPDPERFQVGDPRRAVEQQRKNALLTAIVDGVGPNGPGKYAIVNAIDAADRFIAELDGEPQQ